MSWPAAVVFIVLIVAVAKVMSARYRASAGMTDDKQRNHQWVGNSDPADRQEIAELRERIKVLEQITVDGRETRALSDEIERLRNN